MDIQVVTLSNLYTSTFSYFRTFTKRQIDKKTRCKTFREQYLKGHLPWKALWLWSVSHRSSDKVDIPFSSSSSSSLRLYIIIIKMFFYLKHCFHEVNDHYHNHRHHHHHDNTGTFCSSQRTGRTQCPKYPSAFKSSLCFGGLEIFWKLCNVFIATYQLKISIFKVQKIFVERFSSILWGNVKSVFVVTHQVFNTTEEEFI